MKSYIALKCVSDKNCGIKSNNTINNYRNRKYLRNVVTKPLLAINFEGLPSSSSFPIDRGVTTQRMTQQQQQLATTRQLATTTLRRWHS